MNPPSILDRKFDYFPHDSHWNSDAFKTRMKRYAKEAKAPAKSENVLRISEKKRVSK